MAAASVLLGERLSDPADLGGGRSRVLRCRTAAGGTVVVKSYRATPDGARSFAAEEAGLAFTGAAGVGPRLLAADPAAALIVMTDLGDAPSLADALLGESPAAAESAVLSWARACGRLAAATAGREDELARLTRGAPRPRLAEMLREGCDVLAERAAAAGVAVPAGLDADLAGLASVIGPCPHRVFSPGDLCPDNNLLTAEGFRFLDYEAAGFHCAFLDAAYVRMPFSTCWCVFRLPGELAAAAEAIYRSEVAGVHPGLAADEVWQRGVRLAMAAWTADMTDWLLDSALAADRPMDDVRPSPTARQLLRYRWQTLAEALDGAGEMPVLSELMRRLLAATEGWDVPGLPGYPAFRPAR